MAEQDNEMVDRSGFEPEDSQMVKIKIQ